MGRFVVLEGIDGSGKTTQVSALHKLLSSSGVDCYKTFEPTNLVAGKLIRQILTKEVGLHNKALAPLFVSDRLDHLLNENEGLIAKIKAGTTVVCDRYYFSSYAYHGVDIDMEWVINANSICAELLKPDVTFFIDVAPELAFERIKQNRDTTDLFETLDRLKQVHENYLKAFDKLKSTEKIIMIDGNNSQEQITQAMFEHYSKL